MFTFDSSLPKAGVSLIYIHAIPILARFDRLLPKNSMNDVDFVRQVEQIIHLLATQDEGLHHQILKENAKNRGCSGRNISEKKPTKTEVVVRPKFFK